MPTVWYAMLSAHCAQKNIMFLSTPFDEEAADLLDELDMPAFKIASFEIVYLPLLRHVAREGKPDILSTGMCTLDEI